MTESEVLIDKRDGLGLITLNRPRAINALNHSMALSILNALRTWASDDEVRTVVLTGAGERGLCAGGDIVAIHEDAKKTVEQGASPYVAADSPSGRFWRDEYILNALIGRYPKPYVAIMDGIVMGGGVGLAGHASHRIATERLTWAMPEVGIGFTPDVGGTWLLTRAPGEIGTHLALTGARAGVGDALACGFADAFVPADDLSELVQALCKQEPTAAIAALQQRTPVPAPLLAARDRIDACYAGDRAEDIAQRLAADWPDAAAAVVVGSPTSVKVTLAALRRSAALPSLHACLAAELRTSCGILAAPDFVEGIRAMVVDKDRSPAWDPARLEDVNDNVVADIVNGPSGLQELWSETAAGSAVAAT
jgi:enoyl-CoA hydratase